MTIKRYNSEELIEKCKDVFYDYMVSSPTFYFNGSEMDCTEDRPTPVDFVYDQNISTLKENRARFEVFSKALEKNEENEAVVKIIREQCDFLQQEYDLLVTSNMLNQKSLYNRTGSTEYSRTAVTIPLDKKINSYYDDLFLDVIFYDDVMTLNGRYDEYKKILSKKEKKKFLMDNVEITHLGLAIISQKRLIAVIGLLGKLNTEDPRVSSNNITMLKHHFSDFDNLRLRDTLSVSNNDLRQLLQSKIDLDKENMKLLAEKNVRGDNYRVYESPAVNRHRELYIRYVCPSTGRVYYNTLDLNNLQLSKYYKNNDYESYINSWWSITHLGAPVEGAPIIRC